MKYIHPFLIAILFSSAAHAQIVDPVHWTWKAEHVKSDEYKIILTALIDKPWHTYSQYIVLGKDGGPVITHFDFDKNPDIELLGKMTESGTKVKEGMDDVFGIKLKTFEEKAVFEQHFKMKKPTSIRGSVEAMSCDDKSCLPPHTTKFEVAVP